MASNRNGGTTVQLLLTSPDLAQSLTPENQFDQKKQAEDFLFFFFYSRGTLLRITSSQKMRGKLYYALS